MTKDDSAEPSPDTRFLLRAFRKATRQALWEHKQLGYPVAVWRNERVECLQPEDIDVTRPTEDDE